MPEKTRKKAAAPLTDQQTSKIDEMIADNAKRPDIVTTLVGGMKADTRQVDEYLKQNKTLQGTLNTMSRRAKESLGATSEKDRKKIVDEIVALGKGAVKSLQKKAGQ